MDRNHKHQAHANNPILSPESEEFGEKMCLGGDEQHEILTTSRIGEREKFVPLLLQQTSK